MWAKQPGKIKHHENWVGHSGEFYNACMTLYRARKASARASVRGIGVGLPIDSELNASIHQASETKIPLLLCAGYSIENLLKGIISIRRQNDFLSTSRPSWTKIHDLGELCSLCGFQSDAEQQEMFAELTNMIISGKYPPLIQHSDGYIYNNRSKVIGFDYLHFPTYPKNIDYFMNLYLRTYDELIKKWNSDKSSMTDGPRLI